MAQTFPCPACGTTISAADSEATVTCQFCGKTVPVPAALRGTQSPAAPRSSVPILLAGLGVLVAAAGAFIGLLTLNSSARSAAPGAPVTRTPLSAINADATQGAAARPTTAAQATLTAQAVEDENSAATEQVASEADGAATAEAQALATHMAQTQAAWPVSPADTFDSNRAGWSLGPEGDEFIKLTTAVRDGQYQWQVEALQGNAYWNILPEQGPALADFSASVDVQFGGGGDDGGYAYGLVFRHVNDDYGFFGIQNDSVFRVLVVYGTGIYQHYISTSGAIRTEPGQVNHLAVHALGPDLVFVINDEVVLTLNEDFAPGQVGLGVDVLTTAGPAQVTFDNFEVRAPQ